MSGPPTGMGSYYRMREGDDSVFGIFENCTILGRPAILTARHPSAGEHVLDMLGAPIRESAASIHISGMSDFGGRGGPGLVRAIGFLREQWDGRDKERPSIIAPCAEDWRSPDRYNWKLHIAQWSSAIHFITLDGIYKLVNEKSGLPGTFKAGDILEWINHGKKGCDRIEGKNHTRAINQLLDQMVGVSNEKGGSIHGVTLERAGRWSYYFRAWQ